LSTKLLPTGDKLGGRYVKEYLPPRGEKREPTSDGWSKHAKEKPRALRNHAIRDFGQQTQKMGRDSTEIGTLRKIRFESYLVLHHGNEKL
jgi:hypothetical protein